MGENIILIQIMPDFIKKKIEKRHNLHRVLNNIGWLFLDKVLRMGVGLFVVAWVARYLGPEQYGLWNYAIAFTSLFGAFANLGLDSIVVREIVKYPQRTDEFMGTTFLLKLAGGIIAFILSILCIWILRPNEILIIILASLIAAGFIFQAFLTIDLYYQAHIKSKYTVWTQNAAFLIMAIVKILLILNKAPLVAFAIAGLVEIIIGIVFLVILYAHQKHSIKNWKFSYDTAKSLLNDSWPLILSGLAIMVYMRIDQIMIGQMLDDRAVGIYSAAVKISEVWYFVPMAIAGSVFPTIIKSKELGEKVYYDRLQKYFTLMAWTGIIVAITTTFLGKYIIQLLYGQDYLESASVLIIHIWGGVFVCLGVASSSWLMVENLQRISFYRTLAGGIINIILNLILIPKITVKGAAIATVVSQLFAAYLFDLTNRKTFYIFYLKSRAFLIKG